MARWFKDYRDYWIGLLVISMVGAVINTFHSRTFVLAVDIVLGFIVFLLLSMIVGALVFLLYWIWTKKSSLTIFIKSSIVTCFILTLMHLLDLLIKL